MGPLFAIAIVVIGLCAVTLLAFAIARLFESAKSAAVSALSFAAGSFLGAGIGVVSAIPVVGVGATLSSRLVVVAYLSWLCVAALVSGLLCVRLASRVLTLRSSGRLAAPLS